MNHHPPPLPHGQPPMPPPRRQHEVPYSSAPPNVRSPGYMAYHHPHPHPHALGHSHGHAHAHAHGPVPMPPPYGPQNFQSWYPYQQMPPHPPPMQPYPQYNTPLIVCSYPRPQPPNHAPPPPHMSPALRTQSSTPITSHPSAFSPTPPVSLSTPAITEPQEDQSAQYSLTRSGSEVGSNASTNASTNNSARPTPPPITAKRPEARSGLPWLSVPEAPFPSKPPRRRRKNRVTQPSSLAVELPSKDENETEDTEPQGNNAEDQLAKPASVAQSEAGTPSLPSATVAQQTPAHARQASTTRAGVPVVPVVPLIAQSPSASKQSKSSPQHTPEKAGATEAAAPTVVENGHGPTEDESQPPASSETTSNTTPSPAPQRAAPKSWADLVRSKAAAKQSTAASPQAGALALTRGESLAEALNSFGSNVDQYSEKIAFLEPRGLVNTGNMCYMNSILQVLIFCVPFYEFLDQIGRRAAHSFKSDSPLVDAMIMFLREFRVIDAASSVEKLRLRLKQNELEEYGESFIPEYVYQVIRHLPRFRDMRRGHQQDAQEFLGFLLEELHDECLLATKNAMADKSDVSTSSDVDAHSIADDSTGDGWLEVGHKQKASVTRSSGDSSGESPITRIFSGKIRSEFRVPGNKNSVTLEPYQSLQLDIGSPQVNNIIDALKGLTKPETMHGDFQSSRGPKVNATKQVFIENLPPVLILHLKRFQYDNVTNGTQKIWKKIGYPLELEIPKEVFPPHRRNALSAQNGSLPKYRLIGVIYHHGKSASGGHYTVEVRRQDGREWVRFDDTYIRRVRSEEVAFGGSEEDPKLLSAALERHNNSSDQTSSNNIYDQFDADEQDHPDNGRGWSQVNGSGSGSHSRQKSMAAAAAAAAAASGNASPKADSGKGTPTASSSARFGASRDNKVAYLLFYQRIHSA
ncbi:Ubiquitin carboxyl-terminal hydrolase [Trichophyton interdigitale]|nr:Ubiquitin carboxyl-terminal hydrolase [Trichophyton interdigitale]